MVTGREKGRVGLSVQEGPHKHGPRRETRLGEEKGAGGGEPRQIEAVGPATKQLGPLQLLGPVENISPVQGGLGVSPAKNKEVVGYDADEAD